MSLLFGIITLVYVLLVFYFIFGINKNRKPSEALEAATSFSIVIPFRNEERSLPNLFSSLEALKYPLNLFEIILVNDESEDDSEELCIQFIQSTPIKVRLLQNERNSGSPKKDAISKGISSAEKEFIVTTDADCEVPPNWLLGFSSFLRDSGAEMLCGPVKLKQGQGLLYSFQELDFLSLQGITAGAFGIEQPILCNAANLCYKRTCFYEVGGFHGNEKIASGDDIFLLEKFEAKGLKTAYLRSKDAIVETAAQSTLKSLFSQRIRWASKTSAYNKFFPKAVGVAVFLMNLILVIGGILYLMEHLPKDVLLFSFLFKFNVDFILIYRSASFFNRERSMRNYFWVSAFYPFFCTGVAFLSLFASFSWKGRKFKK